jgi:hypothetical protein
MLRAKEKIMQTGQTLESGSVHPFGAQRLAQIRGSGFRWRRVKLVAHQQGLDLLLLIAIGYRGTRTTRGTIGMRSSLLCLAVFTGISFIRSIVLVCMMAEMLCCSIRLMHAIGARNRPAELESYRDDKHEDDFSEHGRHYRGILRRLV